MINLILLFQRQRYISNAYDNPIRNAVLQQCRQDILDSRFSYVKPLKGDDILKILCMQDCSQSSSTQYQKFGNFQFFTYTIILGKIFKIKIKRTVFQFSS